MERFPQEALLPFDPSTTRLYGLCRHDQLPFVQGASGLSASPQHVAAVPWRDHVAVLHLHGTQGLYNSR